MNFACIPFYVYNVLDYIKTIFHLERTGRDLECLYINLTFRFFLWFFFFFFFIMLFRSIVRKRILSNELKSYCHLLSHLFQNNHEIIRLNDDYTPRRVHHHNRYSRSRRRHTRKISCKINSTKNIILSSPVERGTGFYSV